jgi:hypothetical protein
MNTKFWSKNFKGKPYLEGIIVGGKIKYIHVNFMEMGRAGVDWIHLAQARAEWWAFVKMKHCVS